MGASDPAEERWPLRVLGAADVPALQRFFDANPEYFLAVGGESPRADEAERELADVPPPDMPYRQMQLLGFGDRARGELAGMATVVSDLIAEHVWHIGLFIVATALHGSGAAQTMYAALERRIGEGGARWIRLGVVAGNARAERFWERSGYVETRRRGPLTMGVKSNVLRVMVKPLAGGTLADYLSAVERDRPDSR